MALVMLYESLTYHSAFSLSEKSCLSPSFEIRFPLPKGALFKLFRARKIQFTGGL